MQNKKICVICHLREAEINEYCTTCLGLVVQTYNNPETKIGRNDQCPCGSGRKFKRCCMRLREDG